MGEPEVTIEQGKLRGSVKYNIEREPFYSFQGIPYAKPPVGELRFKAPVLPEKWSGTFDATKEGDSCYSKDLVFHKKIIGSENCLFLNVYTKTLPGGESKNLKPVLFWIHGGGFIFGSGASEYYGPDLLITQDVVIVTINYRLGLLGFLSLDDPSLGVPGNAGLKDMVMALKWVQKNISHFNGDPNKVTIFGESAGGASVHLLTLSPLSKGLFHRAIAQSGCALNPWVQGQPGAQRVAKVLGLPDADEKAVYETLMKKSVEKIFEIQEKMLDKIVPGELRPCGLVIEKQKNESAFLTEHPLDIMSSGKFHHVPFMFGYNTGEGMCFELFKLPNQPDTIDFEEVIPWYFGYQHGSAECKAVADKIKQFYYDSEEPSAKNLGKKFDMLSDAHFVHGIYETIMRQYNKSKAPTYLYRMSIETNLNFFKQIMQIKEPGVSHCDDVGYLFKHLTTPEIKPGSMEETSYRRFVKLWTNFATYGNPTPYKDPLLNVAWKPVKNASIDFVDIGENLVATSKPETERTEFWKKLFRESPNGQKYKL